MAKNLRKNLIAILLIMLCACIVALSFNGAMSGVKAEESNAIDYTKQKYMLFDEVIEENLGYHSAFNNTTEDNYIFRIDCNDLSAQYPDLTEKELVKSKYVYIDYDGDYLYFVNGQAKSNDESRLDDVEILYYDEVKNQVYVKFNFPGYNNSIDMSLKQLNREQGNMCYIKPEDVLAEGYILPESAFYFDVNVKTGNGLREETNGTIFSIDYKIMVHEDSCFEYNFDEIKLTITEGAENYKLIKNTLTLQDVSKTKEGTYTFEIFAIAKNINLEQALIVKAELVYAGASYYAQSTNNSLISLWRKFASELDGAGNFADSYYSDYWKDENGFIYTEKQSHWELCLAEIKKYITAYNTSFNTLLNASTFNDITTSFVPESSHIYKIPLTNLEYACIYFVNGAIDNESTKGATLKIYPNGTTNMSLFGGYNPDNITEIDIYNSHLAISGLNNNYYIQGEYYYFKMNVINSVKEYLTSIDAPANLQVYYLAKDTNGDDVVLQSSANIITYDETILNEINGLKERVAYLEQELLESNKLTQEQAEEIRLLNNSITNLENAYNTLNIKYETLSKQYLSVLTTMEELKAEKNQAIEERLAEISAHKATKEMLEAQIAERDGNIEELTAQLAEVNASIEQNKKALKDLQEDYTELQGRYEELDAEYKAFLESTSGNEQVIANLLHEYKLSVARLEKQVKELKEENANLRNELEKEENSKNGCTGFGCSAGGSNGGIGNGASSTFGVSALALTLFGVMLYVKRKNEKIKE